MIEKSGGMKGIDNNAAGGNLDKWNRLLIDVGYTRTYKEWY